MTAQPSNTRVRPANGVLHSAAALGGLAMAATVDYLVGPEFVLAILYLIPILYAAWVMGRSGGLAVATLSWLLALHNAAVFSNTLPRPHATSILDGITTGIFFLLTAWMTARLHERQVALERMVDEDLVTGAATARRFRELLGNEIYRLSRYRHPFTFAYFDLDNFKAINDSLGHATGDAVLRAVAQEVQASVRAVDCVARLGGDEFALLLPETSAQAAHALLTKVGAALHQRMAGERWPVGFSIGAVTYLTATSVDDALRRADDLMYRVKRGGKDAILIDQW